MLQGTCYSICPCLWNYWRVKENVMNNGQVKSERGYPILIDIQRCLGNHVIRPGVNLHNWLMLLKAIHKHQQWAQLTKLYTDHHQKLTQWCGFSGGHRKTNYICFTGIIIVACLSSHDFSAFFKIFCSLSNFSHKYLNFGFVWFYASYVP